MNVIQTWYTYTQGFEKFFLKISSNSVAMATELLEIFRKNFSKSWVYVYQVWMISVHYEASYSQNKLGRIKKKPCMTSGTKVIF